MLIRNIGCVTLVTLLCFNIQLFGNFDGKHVAFILLHSDWKTTVQSLRQETCYVDVLTESDGDKKFGLVFSNSVVFD